jgi:hypothetical protein
MMFESMNKKKANEDQNQKSKRKTTIPMPLAVRPCLTIILDRSDVFIPV